MEAGTCMLPYTSELPARTGDMKVLATQGAGVPGQGHKGRNEPSVYGMDSSAKTWEAHLE